MVDEKKEELDLKMKTRKNEKCTKWSKLKRI